MRYLTAEQVLFIHARIINETEGAHGVLDVRLLQSAVARPQATFERRDLYPEVFIKAAALMSSLAKNHAFLDGNKRTAVVSTGIFLSMNGLRLEASRKELVRFALDVAVGRLSDNDIAQWLREHTTSENTSRSAR